MKNLGIANYFLFYEMNVLVGGAPVKRRLASYFGGLFIVLHYYVEFRK